VSSFEIVTALAVNFCSTMSLCRHAWQLNMADFTSILASLISGKFQMIQTMDCTARRR